MTQQSLASKLFKTPGFKHVVNPETLPAGFLDWLYNTKNISAMEVVTGQLPNSRLNQLSEFYRINRSSHINR